MVGQRNEDAIKNNVLNVLTYLVDVLADSGPVDGTQNEIVKIFQQRRLFAVIFSQRPGLVVPTVIQFVDEGDSVTVQERIVVQRFQCGRGSGIHLANHPANLADAMQDALVRQWSYRVPQVPAIPPRLFGCGR